MSHELRTPLNSLLLLAQQLEDNPEQNMTPTQVEYASVIHASGNDLLELLNSILDLAKVESGTVTAEMADVSVGELRTALMREFEHVAQANGLGYSIDLTPNSPAAIVTDPQRLRQVLKNLLANAFKFTEAGTVHMQIGTADKGWNRDIASLASAEFVVAFAVADTGIGIRADQQQQIFEAFAQGDGTTARLYGGTGLGLSISRELVHLLGGELTVSSVPGQGSTFTVYLPAGKTSAIASPAVTPAKPGSTTTRQLAAADAALAARTGVVPQTTGSSGYADGAIEGTKILVVDDDFRNIFALSALLERGHADVSVAESGPDAIAILEEKPDFDIVLMDIMMPGMDGYETIRAIRTSDQFTDLPIVAVTGKVVPGERQRCLDAGANDYVPKPVDTAELLAALRPWLPTPAVQPSSEPAPASKPSVAPLVATTPAAATPQMRVPSKSTISSDDSMAALSGVRTQPHGTNALGLDAIDGMKILLVDDDFRNIFALSALLERGHADVTVAESGADAIAALQRVSDIDVVLMDIMMFQNLPIIAVTGKVIPGERQRCLDAGADDYVPKPVHPDELLAALRPWMPASMQSPA